MAPTCALNCGGVSCLKCPGLTASPEEEVAISAHRTAESVAVGITSPPTLAHTQPRALSQWHPQGANNSGSCRSWHGDAPSVPSLQADSRVSAGARASLGLAHRVRRLEYESGRHVRSLTRSGLVSDSESSGPPRGELAPAPRRARVHHRPCSLESSGALLGEPRSTPKRAQSCCKESPGPLQGELSPAVRRAQVHSK
ncbi:hypothetical protein NDU88_005276 [Pleurodeles waltl]|uniref:Uncharacterized protein n=1 Tax=Pleurodeles waltl TaxID=8319 RepID=A0AAV7L722_PLEWA|nr:hypothetical protein NDU88_005276 [Pleurodeles waltl]